MLRQRYMMALARIKHALLHSKCLHVLYCGLAIALVYLYYNAAGPPEVKLDELSRENDNTHRSDIRIKNTQVVEMKSNEDNVKETNNKQTASGKYHSDKGPVSVMITFTNAVNNRGLQDKLHVAVSSLLKHATVDLSVHILGDAESQTLAATILKQHTKADTVKYEVPS